MAFVTEPRIHALFDVSLLLKGLSAVAECLGGIAALFVSPPSVQAIAAALVHNELIEDPADPLAGWLLHLAASYSVGAQRFATYYLLSHGVAKLIVVVALLRERRWAYPVGLAVLGAFVLYQAYRMAIAPSLGLALLTLFDLLVIYLVAHEYRLALRRHVAPRSP